MTKKSEHIVRYTMEEIKQRRAAFGEKTDHEMTHEEAMRRRALDPNIIDFGFDQLDPLVVSWFRQHEGESYGALMNDVLRSYIATQNSHNHKK